MFDGGGYFIVETLYGTSPLVSFHQDDILHFHLWSIKQKISQLMLQKRFSINNVSILINNTEEFTLSCVHV
jgi:hypothetical protein